METSPWWYVQSLDERAVCSLLYAGGNDRVQYAVSCKVHADCRHVCHVPAVYTAQPRQYIVADDLVVHLLPERQVPGRLYVDERAVDDQVGVGAPDERRRLAKVGVEPARLEWHRKAAPCHAEKAAQVFHVLGARIDKAARRARAIERVELHQVKRRVEQPVREDAGVCVHHVGGLCGGEPSARLRPQVPAALDGPAAEHGDGGVGHPLIGNANLELALHEA